MYMRSIRLLASALAVGCSVPAAHAVEKQYGPDDAINHVGERATVCGFVVTAEFAKLVENQPTFLNLAKRYPNEVFTAVIWGAVPLAGAVIRFLSAPQCGPAGIDRRQYKHR